MVFKDYVLIGWNVSILDDDGHELIEKDHLKESQKPILIEDKTWLASNSTILKGVSLAHESIVPYGSIIYKSNQTPNAIWANKIIKENITRIL